MKKFQILILTGFGVFAIMCVLAVQIFWVRAALDINESQFEQTVTIALRQVAEQVAQKNIESFRHKNPVSKINSNTYMVHSNSEIDAEELDYHLNAIFDYFNINFDLEYSIYDCSTNTLVYCDYVKNPKKRNHLIKKNLPVFDQIDYYFIVSFPGKPLLSVNNMPMWIVTSLILMLVLIFFVYALYVVFNQRSVSRIQRDFVNNMTHEFKTPISTISVIQQVLANPDIVHQPERLANLAKIIGIEVNRLNQQVEKVLHTSNPENRKNGLHKEMVSIHEILENISNLNNPVADIVHYSITLEEKAQKDQVMADKTHLTNILSNLIENGIKYSGENAKIQIETFNQADNIRIDIMDNGPGIAKNEIKNIFKKFYRVNTGDVHNVKGFGLGLYYVKKIIEAHHWKIDVRSEVGKGSVFSITIPLISI